MTARDPAAVRDAASLILLRRGPGGGSVLMGMRGQAAAFMPSKFVFPGGAVDAGDADLPLARPLAGPHRRRLLAEPSGAASPEAIAAAALRELAEETGLLIGQPCLDAPRGPAPFAASGLCPDAGALTYLFRAITPPGRTRRFDAHFFVAEAEALSGDPEDFGAACDELSHLHWVGLDEARQLDLPFITEVVLAELAQLAAAAGTGPLPVPEHVPFFDNRGPSPRFTQIR